MKKITITGDKQKLTENEAVKFSAAITCLFEAGFRLEVTNFLTKGVNGGFKQRRIIPCPPISDELPPIAEC